MILWQAWRAWRSAKGVAIFAGVALAAGIGSATAIYTVINGVMLKPLPYPEGDRFVLLLGSTFTDPDHFSSLQSKDAEIYRQRTRVFDAFGWFRESGKNLIFAGQPLHVEGVAVTLPFPQQIGVGPEAGQWFQDENGVVISKPLWRQLGSDPAIIGKPLTLDGRSYTVTGIMPESFRLPVAGAFSFGQRPDLWIALNPTETGAPYFAYARRKPGVTFAAAEADVSRVAAEIAAEDPATHDSYTARLLDLRETVVQDIRPTLMVLFGAAGLLFLITCANAAGLLLARSVDRARETAVRVALGARRGQLAAYYFSEGLLVSLLGAAGGIVLSMTLTPAIVSMAASYIPRAEEITVDWTVLLFAIASAIVASACSSLAPLWHAATTVPADVLGEGVRASAGARSRSVSQLLVVAEIALAFGLLAVSAVLLIHVRNLSRTPVGFDPDGVLTFVLSVPGPLVDDLEKRIPLHRRFINAFREIPGVEEVAVTSHLPLNGCCFGTAIYPDGGIADSRVTSQRTSVVSVSPGYFRTMRVPLRSGRTLTERDVAQNLAYAVVSESAARVFWGNTNPVGSYGRFGQADGDRFQVIGVVGDIKNDGLNSPTVPEVYILSFIPRLETLSFAVRSNRPAASLLPEIRRVVHNIDPEQPIHEIATMREIVQQTMTLQRAASFMTSFFAAAGLLLATLGIYSAVSYSVRQRTVEIGTRMALGATSGGVLSFVVGGGLKMAALGVTAGSITAIAAAVYWGRAFGIPQLGPAPLLYSTATVTVVAFTASVLPAWRAALLSPIVAIRNEPESMWQAARLKVRRAIQEFSAPSDRPPVPVGALITEFAASTRQAASFPEVVQSALSMLQQKVGAESVMLLEKSGDEYRDEKNAISAHNVLLNRLKHYPHPLPLNATDFDTWMRWASELRTDCVTEIEKLANTGARLAVPLRAKNEIIGLLLLGPPSGRDTYTADEKQLLSSSAEVFALMIENAHLNERALEQEKLRRELALAAEVQQRLLPVEPPSIEGADLAAHSIPARTVGGDYYDFISLPGGRLGIAIADVAGKGIAAALLMSVVQASLRVISAETDLPLSQLAEKMNGFLYASTEANRYATFFYAELEKGMRRLRYVNAGHNAPYLVRVTGGSVEIRELKIGGTVIGLFPVMQYEAASVELVQGDLLIAFTDGVTEALNAAGEEFGDERLKDLLQNSATASAKQISVALQARLREWIGPAEQHDDLTFVVVKVR